MAAEEAAKFVQRHGGMKEVREGRMPDFFRMHRRHKHEVRRRPVEERREQGTRVATELDGEPRLTLSAAGFKANFGSADGLLKAIETIDYTVLNVMEVLLLRVMKHVRKSVPGRHGCRVECGPTIFARAVGPFILESRAVERSSRTRSGEVDGSRAHIFVIDSKAALLAVLCTHRQESDASRTLTWTGGGQEVEDDEDRGSEEESEDAGEDGMACAEQEHSEVQVGAAANQGDTDCLVYIRYTPKNGLLSLNFYVALINSSGVEIGAPVVYTQHRNGV